jgi:hypothetical protein
VRLDRPLNLFEGQAEPAGLDDELFDFLSEQAAAGRSR